MDAAFEEGGEKEKSLTRTLEGHTAKQPKEESSRQAEAGDRESEGREVALSRPR